uniref:Acyltransferase-like protein At3g26840ic n=1 Tax=Rhizophora mucronata TaxID=61149 RepID=A0A2P2LET8_RHIMU
MFHATNKSLWILCQYCLGAITPRLVVPLATTLGIEFPFTVQMRRDHIYVNNLLFHEGRKKELRDREKAHELYLQVKSEVEKCLAFLKEKREEDPYRNILARLAYQATHGVTSKIPTFEL